MALDTQEKLIKTVIDYSHRTDLGVRVNNFIILAETEMLSNPKAPLKLNLGETISTYSTSTVTRFLALPAGFQSSRKFSITINNKVRVLQYRTPSTLNIKDDTGTPCFFTIRANQIEFDILSDKAYTLTFTYFAEFQPLTLANQTNIVLTKYPNIYLFGCLRQAFLYAQDMEQASIYANEALNAIVSANKTEKFARYGSQLQITSKWAP